MTRGEKVVMRFFAECWERFDGKISPSFDLIAEHTELSRRHVVRVVTALALEGFIEVRQRRSRNKMIIANRYEITPKGVELLRVLTADKWQKHDEIGSDMASLPQTPELAKHDGNGSDTTSLTTYRQAPLEAPPATPKPNPSPRVSISSKACPFGESCRDAVNALKTEASSECAVCYQTLTRESLYGVFGLTGEPRTPADFARQLQEQNQRRALRAIAELRSRHD